MDKKLLITKLCLFFMTVSYMTLRYFEISRAPIDCSYESNLNLCDSENFYVAIWIKNIINNFNWLFTAGCEFLKAIVHF